jgi:hypothetical protein
MAPVKDWPGFSERYPDLASTVRTIISVGYTYDTLKRSFQSGENNSTRERLSGGMRKGDYMLLEAAFQNEEMLQKWDSLAIREGGSSGWNPDVFAPLYTRRAGQGPENMQKKLTLDAIQRTDDSIRTWWYYYVVQPILKNRLAAQAVARWAVQRFDVNDEAAREVVRLQDQEARRAEISRQAEIAERTLRAEAAVRKRTADIEHFEQQLYTLFPDKAAQVMRILNISG